MSFLELLTNETYGLGNDLVLDTILQLIFLVLLIRNDGLTGINISGGTFFNTGSISSSGTIDFDFESVSNFGEISGENVSLDLGNLDNFGTIDAVDQVDIEVDYGANNGIISAGTEQVSADEITSPIVSILSTDSLMATNTTTPASSSTETIHLSHFLLFLQFIVIMIFKIKS